jgi:hypothetical protein
VTIGNQPKKNVVALQKELSLSILPPPLNLASVPGSQALPPINGDGGNDLHARYYHIWHRDLGDCEV